MGKIQEYWLTVNLLFINFEHFCIFIIQTKYAHNTHMHHPPPTHTHTHAHTKTERERENASEWYRNTEGIFEDDR